MANRERELEVTNRVSGGDKWAELEEGKQGERKVASSGSGRWQTG